VPSIAGDAVGDERGEELALDGHHATGGDALEERGVQEVGPGVHRVRGDRVVARRLLAEAADPPVCVRLDEPVLTRVADAGEKDRRP